MAGYAGSRYRLPRRLTVGSQRTAHNLAHEVGILDGGIRFVNALRRGVEGVHVEGVMECGRGSGTHECSGIVIFRSGAFFDFVLNVPSRFIEFFRELLKISTYWGVPPRLLAQGRQARGNARIAQACPLCRQGCDSASDATEPRRVCHPEIPN
ncbi:MAG: hypothetical protein P4L99_02240 [Chthoniobacter sp.]|nr:hypothetical protein [Chthoniobacter sp.]